MSHEDPPQHGIDIARDHPEVLRRLPAVAYVAEPGEHGRWFYVGPQIESILGYTAEEWCADPKLWLNRLHPEDRERVYSRELAFDELGMIDVEEYRLLHRDGHPVWIRDEAELVEGPDGRPIWRGVLCNVSVHRELEAELELRAAQQAAVANFGERALEGASADELVELAVRAALELPDAESAAVGRLEPDEQYVALRRLTRDSPELEHVRVPFREDTLAGHTLSTGHAGVIEDLASEPHLQFAAAQLSADVRSGCAVPIEGMGGRWGFLGVHYDAPRRFNSGEVDFLQSLAHLLADALQRQAIEDEIRHSALHDPLTGLPNRVLFLDRIEQALNRLRRRHTQAAVLFLDFDHFKVINESLGHHVGDELLSAAAPRIKHAVRASDTVAHFGGDEFAILLEDIGSEAEAIEMAERIAALFARPFVVAGNEHFVSASVGIAIARGGELPMELIRDADAAMYRAKERGRSRYEVFDEAMRNRALARLRLENDLRRALERNELRLEYQPLVSLHDGALVGVEALLRWNHPQRGLITPDEFIPVAEDNGLIEPIGRWVLERACRQAAHWHASAPDARPLEVAVNLSTVQLTKPGLVETVQGTIEATDLDPATLSLEITETAMMRDPDAVAEVLSALGALGVRLVLDDFGTGYSSLSLLPTLPLDALKIDRSFVSGLGTEPRDRAIAEAILAMSKALSLSVVAEGVEDETQVRELSRLGCEQAQGFYFCRPVPASEITAILHEGPRWSIDPDRR